MARGIVGDIDKFLRRAAELRATAVLKLFMVPEPELRLVRCESCGRLIRINLRGTSRPVCSSTTCPSRVNFPEEPCSLYHVFPRKEGEGE